MTIGCVGDPPECCQPEPVSYRQRLDEMRARQPERCAACGGDDLAPLFPGDEWSCEDCGDVREYRP